MEKNNSDGGGGGGGSGGGGGEVGGCSELVLFGCTRLYFLYLDMAVLWTKGRYFGNLVPTICTSPKEITAASTCTLYGKAEAQ